MKHSLTLLVSLLLLPLFFIGQNYTHVYYMDHSFNSVQKEKAVIICKGFNDTTAFKLDCFTMLTDMPVLSAEFTDSSIGTLNGIFRQFYDSGMVQTQGNYRNNLKHGVWEDWNLLGEKTDSAWYKDGIRLGYAKYSYYYGVNKTSNKKGIYVYTYCDSLADNSYTNYYTEDGLLESILRKVGEQYVWTDFTANSSRTDTVMDKVEIEASFPGGNAAWTRYLERSLGGFNPADHGAPNGTWKVLVRFIVDKDGSVSNVKAETNFGHKMEEMAIRTIANGPKWKPALHNGRSVKAFRSQPITFVVEGM